MKVTIDKEIAEKWQMSMADVSWLMTKYYDKELHEEKMERMYLHSDGTINQTGVSVLENIFLESEDGLDKNMDTETGEILEEEVTINGETFPLNNTNDLAMALKAIYPKGMKEVGSSYYPWSDSTEQVAKRLKIYFKRYGKKDFKDVVRATANYVNRFDGEYDGMWILRNFIFKDKVVNGVLDEISYLDTEIEMLGEEYEDYETIGQ